MALANLNMFSFINLTQIFSLNRKKVTLIWVPGGINVGNYPDPTRVYTISKERLGMNAFLGTNHQNKRFLFTPQIRRRLSVNLPNSKSSYLNWRANFTFQYSLSFSKRDSQSAKICRCLRISHNIDPGNLCYGVVVSVVNR